MSEPVIHLEYEYSSRDEVALSAILSAMQADVGGKRRPWGGRAGAIDLVTFLELAITFVAGATLGEVVKSYLAGLTGMEKAKKIGEHHHEVILEWLATVKGHIGRIVSSVRKRFREGLCAPQFEGMEEPIALRLGFGQIMCYIVLNSRHVSDDTLERLPEGVTDMLRYIGEIGLPEETTVLQLCPDPNSHKWRYLLVPSHQAFGRFVDRIVDLPTGQLIPVHSRKEFIDVLGVTQAEGIKFLVNPYRYPDAV